MTVWIQKQDNEIADDFIFSAYLGFQSMGKVIQFFTRPEKIHFKEKDIVVGDLKASRYILKKLNIDLPNFYIPDELKKYAGRNFWQDTVGNVVNKYREDRKPIFIKPINTKEFPAQVITMLPLITWAEQTIQPQTQCWVSEPIDIVSEWRVFVSNYEIVGCQYYLGDFKRYPDWNVIDSALKDIQWQPKGWTMDFGVTANGETILIETNDGYSIGDYGLESFTYATILRNRWFELTVVKSLI